MIKRIARQMKNVKGWLPELVLLLAVVGIIVATAWLNLPVAAWGPAIVAALGIIYARISSREQVRVAERKLFLDLIPRRLDWLDRLNDASAKRDAEMAANIERMLDGKGMEPPVQLWRMYDCAREAGWLLDEQCKSLVYDVIAASAALDEVRLRARQGDRAAAFDVSDKASVVITAMNAVHLAMHPYLYVGDIRTQSD